MKKRSLILVILCLVVFFLCFWGFKQFTINEFNMLDYENEIEMYPSDKNVGEITDKKTAKQKAKKLWCEEYSFIEQNTLTLVNAENINVLYDDKNDCWYIYGVVPKKFDGAAPHALIKSSGEVLSVWIG